MVDWKQVYSFFPESNGNLQGQKLTLEIRRDEKMEAGKWTD